MKLTDKNSMRVGSSSMEAPLPDLSALEDQGYTLVPIQAVQVLYGNPHAARADASLIQLANRKEFDVILSGPDASLVSGGGSRPPHGPVYRHGKSDTEGTGRGHFRGTVAVLQDGSIVMSRADGAGAKDLRSRFGQPGNALHAALGGGALLLEHGRFVEDLDLMRNQLFGGIPGGIRGKSMLRGPHSIMAIRKGKAYAAWCHTKSALDIRDDFRAFEFGAVIKFSHGSSVFYDDGENRLNGQNATGFGITRAY